MARSKRSPAPKVDALMAELKTIRSVLDKNTSLIRKAVDPKDFGFFSFISGLMCLTWGYFADWMFTHHADYNLSLRTALIISFGVLLLFATFSSMWKNVVILRNIRKDRPDYTIWRIMKDIYPPHYLHVVITSNIVYDGAIIYSLYIGAYELIVPLILFAIAVGFNFVYALTRIKTYMLHAYFSLASGILIFIFRDTFSPFLAAGWGIGGGFALLGAALMIRARKGISE
jgi:hypothetical protein